MGDHNTILIIEDDPLIVDFLELGLRYEKFEVYAASDGRSGLELFDKVQPKLVILDLMLPGLHGGEVCKRLRAQTNVPILVLTARDALSDKVNLFTLGADDYIVKPFNFDELLARIRRALERQGSVSKSEEIRFFDLVLRTDTREVSRGGAPIEVSAKEFDLLHFLMSNPRRVLTKETILNQVWGYDFLGDSNIVEVYMSHLRRKLGEPSVIQTVRGVGYSLRG